MLTATCRSGSVTDASYRINADGIIGKTGDLLGHNLFAYCKNNPVNMSDSAGFRPMFDDGYGRETSDQVEASLATMSEPNRIRYEENQRNHAYDSESSQTSTKKSRGTFGFGVSGMVECGTRFSFTAQIVVDTHFNIGLSLSPGVGGGTIGAGGSISAGPIPLGGGIDYVGSNGINGVSINLGPKFEPIAEGHTDVTYTWINFE